MMSKELKVRAVVAALARLVTLRVKPEWLDKTGRATEAEQDLIDLESGTDERSRLSCQVEMTEALDGLVVEVAPF
jgi:2Fe-2S ferredoxin